MAVQREEVGRQEEGASGCPCIHTQANEFTSHLSREPSTSHLGRVWSGPAFLQNKTYPDTVGQALWGPRLFLCSPELCSDGLHPLSPLAQHASSCESPSLEHRLLLLPIMPLTPAFQSRPAPVGDSALTVTVPTRQVDLPSFKSHGYNVFCVSLPSPPLGTPPHSTSPYH